MNNTKTPLDAYFQELFSQYGYYVFMIVGCANITNFAKQVKKTDPTAQIESLFKGTNRQFEDNLPHLVKVHAAFSPIFRQAFDQWWGRGRVNFFFLLSHHSFDEVRNHFREQFYCRCANGDLCSFEFYDPTVLKLFLRESSEHERTEWMGPADHIIGEIEGSHYIFQFPRPFPADFSAISPSDHDPVNCQWHMQSHHNKLFEMRQQKLDGLVGKIRASSFGLELSALYQGDEPSIIKCIEYGLGTAYSYWFRLPEDFTRFVEFMVQYDPEFDKYLTIQSELKYIKRPDSERLDEIEAKLITACQQELTDTQKLEKWARVAQEFS